MNNTILQQRADMWLGFILRLLKEFDYEPKQYHIERLGDFDGVSFLMLDLLEKPDSEVKDATLKRDFFYFLYTQPVSPPATKDEFKHCINQVAHMLPLCINSFSAIEEPDCLKIKH